MRDIMIRTLTTADFINEFKSNTFNSTMYIYEHDTCKFHLAKPIKIKGNTFKIKGVKEWFNLSDVHKIQEGVKTGCYKGFHITFKSVMEFYK